jgi:hypothetical protein
MVKDKNLGLMDLILKDNIKKEKRVDKENIFGAIIQNIKVNGKKIK